jgi:ABC-type uncharacterized transport system auxiliary subunit
MGLWLAACGLLAAGCGGGGGNIPESRIYRIGYAPPAPASAGNPLPVTLGVAGLGGPETYRQERLVYRTVPHKVAFYPYDRWEVPPVEMVTEVLIGQLRAGGRYRRVVPYTRDGQVDYVLRGRLLRFDEEDGGPGTPWTAVVEIDYQLVDPQKNQVVSTGAARATQPVQGRQVEAIVESLSVATRDALASVAAQVAQAISSPGR